MAEDTLTKWVVGVVASGIVTTLVFLAKAAFGRSAEREKETTSLINEVRSELKALAAQMVAGNDRIAAKLETLAATSHQLEGRLNMGNQTFEELRKTDSRQWEELKDLKAMVMSLFRRSRPPKEADP